MHRKFPQDKDKDLESLYELAVPVYNKSGRGTLHPRIIQGEETFISGIVTVILENEAVFKDKDSYYVMATSANSTTPVSVEIISGSQFKIKSNSASDIGKVRFIGMGV